jgi:hypothetical protein
VIPNYIADTNPYKKVVYGTFESVVAAADGALTDLGWSIESQAEPSTYERERSSAVNLRQTLIFTNVRQTSMFLGTRYARMNVFVREQLDNQVEVEIRYVTVSSVIFKTMYDYTEDRGVKNILEAIEKKLE